MSVKFKRPKMDSGNPDPIKWEEEKMRNMKLAQGGSKSRVHWSFSDISDEDWPFGKGKKA